MRQLQMQRNALNRAQAAQQQRTTTALLLDPQPQPVVNTVYVTQPVPVAVEQQTVIQQAQFTQAQVVTQPGAPMAIPVAVASPAYDNNYGGAYTPEARLVS